MGPKFKNLPNNSFWVIRCRDLAAIVQNLKMLASQLWQPAPDALAESAM